MKNYLEATIREEIHRGEILKDLIPHPLPTPELMTLAQRCESIIDATIDDLRLIKSEFRGNRDINLRQILRAYKACHQNLSLVEGYGISALHFKSSELEYMNKLVFKIHQEINLPISPPLVACFSTQYYFFQTYMDVIFVPVGESESLLHIPDLFHEISHAVLQKMKLNNNVKLKGLFSRWNEIATLVTEYFNEIYISKIRQGAPKETQSLVQYIHDHWKQFWLEEYLCDLFAVYALGPAYINAHIHLTTKKSQNVYLFSIKKIQTHPSEDSRMKMMLFGLNKMGVSDEAKNLLYKWQEMIYVKSAKPIPEYQTAYPEILMKKICDIYIAGLNNLGIKMYDVQNKEKGSLTIIKTLNEAWDAFFEKRNFREWEIESIRKIKKLIQ